jgi:hypothetical protein
MEFAIPSQLLREPSFGTTVFSFEDWVIIGFADGSIIVSELLFNAAELKFSW